MKRIYVFLGIILVLAVCFLAAALVFESLDWGWSALLTVFVFFTTNRDVFVYKWGPKAFKRIISFDIFLLILFILAGAKGFQGWICLFWVFGSIIFVGVSESRFIEVTGDASLKLIFVFMAFGASFLLSCMPIESLWHPVGALLVAQALSLLVCGLVYKKHHRQVADFICSVWQ